MRSNIKLVFLGVGFLMTGCIMTKPEVSINCSTDNSGSLIVELTHNSRVHGVGEFDFWKKDAPEYLWKLKLHKQPKTFKVEYGVIPDKTQGVVATQIFPAQGDPAPIFQGDVFLIRATYYYDSVFSANMGTVVHKFRMKKSGHPESFGLTTSYRTPDNFSMPNRKKSRKSETISPAAGYFDYPQDIQFKLRMSGFVPESQGK